MGGLELSCPRPVRHHQPVELPPHLPLLVQAYADQLELPGWPCTAAACSVSTGSSHRSTGKADLRQVYRLAPGTRVALELFVDNQVLEGVWARRRQLLDLDLSFTLSLCSAVGCRPGG